ncbi:PREDICTED: serine/threonine-protein kinase atr-like [Nicrophorus vespilloides]|uniref:Serine/threonine-protein kinase ATR n=1 Tax=Nicrophorus vespilloides TaxID=110193 RepID=A0ABM1M791_NICVS|nr:PREDICTED: serine/threonine-protein kinase atr-like [Nicrophorus vespilloides]
MNHPHKIPAFSMWKMFNDTIPVMLKMESSESSLNMLTNILAMPEFSRIFLFNTNSSLTFQQHKEMSGKYKAFAVWLLGRFFYLLSLEKLSRMHNLIIDAHKKILHIIEISQSYIYHELTLEYAKVLKDLIDYQSHNYEDTKVLKAFEPKYYEDLDGVLDLSPLFVEVSSRESCIHMQKIALKIIDQIVMEKLEFHYIKNEIYEILYNLIYILKNSNCQLKIMVLEIFARVMNLKSSFPYKIETIFRETFSIFEQLCYKVFNNEFPDFYEQFQAVTKKILNGHRDFNKRQISEFILSSKKVKLDEDLVDICVKYTGEGFNAKYFKLYAKTILSNLTSCENNRIDLKDVSGTWRTLMLETGEYFEGINSCVSIPLNASCDKMKHFLDVLNLGTEIKTVSNKQVTFFNETPLVPMLLNHIVNDSINCKTKCLIMSSMLTNIVYLTKTRNLNVYLHLIGYKFMKSKEFPTNYIGCNNSYEMKKSITYLYTYLANLDVPRKTSFHEFCYFVFISAIDGSFRDIEDYFMAAATPIIEHHEYELQLMLIPYISNILSSSVRVDDMLSKIIIPMLISQDLQVLREVSYIAPTLVIILSSNHSRCIKYSKMRVTADFFANGELQRKLKNIETSSSSMAIVIQAIFNLLSFDDEIIKMNAIKTLPLLSKYVPLFHKIKVVKWMQLLEDEHKSVREEFGASICEIVKHAQASDSLTMESKSQMVDNIYDILLKATKKSLQYKPDLQSTILETIRNLSHINKEEILLHTMTLMAYFIMMPISNHSIIAVNVITDLPTIHNTTMSKLYSRFRRELCKIIVNLCVINQALVNYNLATSLEKISFVFGFFGPKNYIVEESRYLLPLFVPLIVKIDAVKKLIDEMAYMNEIDLSELLTSKYGYIFLQIFLNCPPDVSKMSMKYIEINTGLDGSTLRKQNVMVILNELLLNFHDNRSRVISALENLAKDFDSENSISDFLQPRFLGVLQYFDLKLMGQSVTKRKVLLSLAQIFDFMGSKIISPLRFKIIAMLKTALNVTKSSFPELNCDVWNAFIKSCDIEVLGPHLATIAVSILPVIEINPKKVNDILIYLVRDNEEALKDFIADLFFVLDCEKVDYAVIEIVKRYMQEVTSSDFKEHLKHFLKYLSYETNEVRIYGIKYITVLLKQNREELDRMILGYNGIDDCVVELLDILTLGCREEDVTLKLACGECIGELGAIEPSHLPRKYTPQDTSFSFFITDPNFIVNTLNELTKTFQSEKNTQQMDRFALAIQEILKFYSISPDRNSQNNELWKQFSDSQQELMIPLLSSKYTMVQAIGDIKVSPIYGSNFGSNFQTWLYSWSISLIYSIRSNKKTMFEACAPSMKQDQKTLMYFLPYILLHALIEGSNNDQERAYKEFMAVIQSRNNAKISDNLLHVRPLRTENFISFEHTSGETIKSEQYTKVVFVLLDFLDRWLRKWLWNAGFQGRNNENYKKIKAFLSNFCKLQLAQCNYDCAEYPRALMYLEDYMAENGINDNLSFLAEIYYCLHEPDGVAGVTALRQREPFLEERILALEVSGKLSDAAACYERINPPLKLKHVKGLVKCYLDLDNVNTALNFCKGELEKQPEYQKWLIDVQAESFWRLGRYDDLDKFLAKNDFMSNSSWGSQMGHALIHLKNGSREEFKSKLGELRMAQVDCLSAASLEEGAYQQGYFYISRLHALNEVEQIEHMLNEILLRPSECQNLVKKLKSEWELRLKVVQETVKVIEPVLCLRRVSVEQAKSVLEEKCPAVSQMLDTVLGDSWLKSAEIARRAGIHQQAYTYLLKAETYSPTKLFIEKAKLHWMREEHEQAFTALKRGLDKYFPDFNPSNGKRSQLTVNFPKDNKKICAEAQLLIASYNDSISNVDMDTNLQNYKEAVDMLKEWEKSLVSMAQYFDRIFQSYTDEEKDTKGNDIQLHMINFFGKSLLYGNSYVYQSMPRMLSIWFDYGTRLLDVTSTTIRDERRINLLKMTKLVDNSLEILPLYIFFTAFSQLVSRICHPQKEVHKELKLIIIKLILQFPQQSLWMIISVIKSSYSLRSKRCNEILSDSRLKTPEMVRFITDFVKLAEKLIELCNKEIIENVKTTSVSLLMKSLPRLITKEGFSQIMIPTHLCRKLVLPNPDFSSDQHNPFPNRFVHIIGIEDEITILQSLQKPRKITFRGSDGKSYIQMLKPKDDLRKDFRLMEFNDIVNQMLSREVESRQRRLLIRLYSVAPLNEECGLIEWIPNLVCFRHALLALYEQRGFGMKNKELKEICPKLNDPLSKKKDIFLKKLIPKYPLILGEWFRKTFPDAQGWLSARTAYIRTTAVISMVGYILGLGDRHGDNILLDSTCGDTVHVDFNCLFNKGETFEWPERVPFRLTRNMVSAMGPLGVEGVYRKSCAATLRVLRTHVDTLMSIVTPFVYDPLVSWPRNAPAAASAQNAERINELACEHIREIKRRLLGQVRTKGRSFSIPLSVEGQTNNLILEAMNIENLCQMYIGWGAYM